MPPRRSIQNKKTVVVALGGNAMLQPGQAGDYEAQFANVMAACEQIHKLTENGWNVIMTSGNGPQVGAIKLQQSSAKAVAPEMPLHVCGSMSQGFIGYMMQMAMGNVQRAAGLEPKVVCTLTQSLVSTEDPAFANPTKPVGAFYSEAEAKEMIAAGKTMKEDAGRGYRVVVPSPRPQEIVERPAIMSLVGQGFTVICTNGGGIPVVKDAAGNLVGCDAVIDKDLATSLLAQQVKADALMILTDVTNACVNYRKPNQTQLGVTPLAQAKVYEAEGQFAAGSMGPKVRACMEFCENTGRTAIITSLNKAVDAINGLCGTHIVADQ
ncbi:carbamate kinase [Kipferlia bialata]|uniref:Carbamate kinase n=1 Tax=Kipferlia bialata TaxID=797122 RepID=A0A391NLA7_9EUKA|nr:carbamate kinase [Kipferlia bialata]|eukprot:g466.t1